MDCANWDKSVKLGTQAHNRLFVKIEKETHPESHVTAYVSNFRFGKYFTFRPKVAYMQLYS